jgi:radical SAM protein with 4Fe4S-binding SPASM domain
MTDPRSQLKRLAHERCIPLSVTMELTLRCPLRCAHCYNFDRSTPPPSPAALTDAEVLGIIDQLRDAGCMTVAFTGGEPLTHPSLDAFVAHAAARRLRVVLKSNATLLSAPRARRLVEAGCRAADIGLYGASARTCDAFTGIRGSFERALAGIRAALEAGIHVRLNFPIVRTNADEIDAMIGLAERLGAEIGLDPQITARYDGTRGSLDLRVDRATLERLYAGPLRQMRPSPCFDGAVGVQCNCARSVCGISSTAEVYPCIGAPLAAGNLRRQSFAQIWRDSPVLRRIRGLTLDDFAVCKPCPDRPWCRRNSGVAYVNTGNYTGPEPFTCMEANVLRGIEAPAAIRT